MGMSMVDALDTMWIMGMRDEFMEAQQWLVTNLDFDKVRTKVSFFETAIRALGGVLSAYDLSGDNGLLGIALDLGERYARSCQQPRNHGHNYSQSHTHIPIHNLDHNAVCVAL